MTTFPNHRKHTTMYKRASLAAIASVLILGACAESDDDASREAGTVERAETTEAPEVTDAPVMTTEAPTTTAAPTTTEACEEGEQNGTMQCQSGEWVYAPTTTQAPTTTAPPPPPTTIPVDPMLAVNQLNDGRLLVVADTLEEDFVMDRVDIIRIDGVDAMSSLVISGSSGYNTPEYQQDKVWELVTLLSNVLWSASNDQVFQDMNLGLDLTMDGVRYVSDEAGMIAVRDRTIAQADWLNQHRG